MHFNHQPPISGHTELYCLLGEPVAHSLSPAMYNYCFKAAGADKRYVAFLVKANDMEAALQGMRVLGIRGANVTMPCKKKAAALADDVTPVVHMTESCNVLINEAGFITAYNTDGIGLVLSLAAEGFHIAGKRLLILGAGGAAAAITAQCAIDGAAIIDVFNRKSPSFTWMEGAIKRIKAGCKNVLLNLFDTADRAALKHKFAEADLLINATSIGMAPEENQFPLPSTDLLRRTLPVCDIIYNPEETLLLKEAKKKGAPIFNGKGMLLYQGAAAYKLFTGLDMPVSDVARDIFKF